MAVGTAESGDVFPVHSSSQAISINTGHNVEYYLLKAGKVVGVEANPSLCRIVEQRFAHEIREGRLLVLNVALATDERAGRPVDFYVHKANHVLSQLDVPDSASATEFERVQVESRRPAEVIREHGNAGYIKVDLEGLDAAVLRDIFDAGIRPSEISAESHSVDVFACLVEAGYKAFSLVDGWSVSEKYGDVTIDTVDGPRKFSFKPHSAGPFGADIRSEWQDPQTFFYTLAAAGLGWKDIHASNLIEPAPAPAFRKHVRRQATALARQVLRGLRSRVSQMFRQV